MVGARNLLRRHYDSYGSCFSDTTYKDFHRLKSSMIPNLMAEQISRTGGGDEEEEEEEDDDDEEEEGTSSKDVDDHEPWLRLSIGGQSSSDIPARTQEEGNGSQGRGRLMELQLFSDRPTGHLQSVSPTIRTGRTPAGMMIPFLPAGAVRPLGFFTSQNPVFASSGSTSTPPRFDYRPYIYPQWSLGSPSVIAGSSMASRMRIVSPPRRRQAGLWFMLEAAQNQEREPFLPQIPKNYLRIRDERMTVRMVIKYLVNKLGLEDESEIEIKCRGQQLHYSLTLQYVRDHIWCSPEIAAEDFPTTAADHVMTLQYSRSNQIIITTAMTTMMTTTTTTTTLV
ncbi:putative protein LAX PANICLE 2 [Dioscorea sansibarensis]